MKFSGVWLPSYPYIVRYGSLHPSELPAFTVPQFCTTQNEKRYQFYTRLKESIEKEGFRNPILYFHRPGDRVIPYGHSRATIAKVLSIEVPAIIVDWQDKYTHFPRLDTVEEIRKLFTDQPTVVEYWEGGVNIWGCRQVHLAKEHADYFQDFQRKRDIDRLQKGRGYQTLDEYERFSPARADQV